MASEDPSRQDVYPHTDQLYWGVEKCLILQDGISDTQGLYTSMNDGMTYRKKWNDEVNANHSLEDVQRYVGSLSKDSIAEVNNPDKEIPYASVGDSS